MTDLRRKSNKKVYLCNLLFMHFYRWESRKDLYSFRFLSTTFSWVNAD